jgi:hypothetical protein
MPYAINEYNYLSVNSYIFIHLKGRYKAILLMKFFYWAGSIRYFYVIIQLFYEKKKQFHCYKSY